MARSIRRYNGVLALHRQRLELPSRKWKQERDGLSGWSRKVHADKEREKLPKISRGLAEGDTGLARWCPSSVGNILSESEPHNGTPKQGLGWISRELREKRKERAASRPSVTEVRLWPRNKMIQRRRIDLFTLILLHQLATRNQNYTVKGHPSSDHFFPQLKRGLP